MQQIVNINGYETVIEIPEGQVLSPVMYSGDRTGFFIEYGNGLVKTGGIATINASSVGNGVIEGETTVSFETPFSQVLDYQVTAIDVGGKTIKETAHIGEVTNDNITIYGGGTTNSPEVILVKWFVEGIK